MLWRAAIVVVDRLQGFSACFMEVAPLADGIRRCGPHIRNVAVEETHMTRTTFNECSRGCGERNMPRINTICMYVHNMPQRTKVRMGIHGPQVPGLM
jgi:hypothetical protein